MAIETLSDVLEELADRFGVYGACKHPWETECTEGSFCCRVAFVHDYAERIRAAVEIEQRLRKGG